MSADSSRDRLDRIFAELERSLERATEEELRDEIRAEGRDPDQVAASVGSLFDRVLREHRQQPLRKAQAGYREGIGLYRERPSRIPKTAEARRALLASFAATPGQLTAQFRDLEQQSDDDVTSALMQLEQLGLLPEVDDEE
jgi:hypothetical protein